MPGNIEVQRASVVYGRVQALYDVSFTAAAGRITGVLGANGAGKSTLLRAISGFAALRAGAVIFNGRDLSRSPAYARSRAGILHVFEGGKAFSELTVAENLEVGGYRLPPADVVHRCTKMYELFPRLQERRAQRADTLSGGERQMLLLARALMAQPSVLLLDEPSLGLAPRVVASTFEQIKAINEMGVTIILVEQKATLALDTCDDCYVLRNGRVILHGSAADVKGAAELRHAYL
jgi:branched-chain amino acid transport system ATP-binding protein